MIALVIVVPEEGILDFTHICSNSIRIREIGSCNVRTRLSNICTFAQPILMANLRMFTILTLIAATIEVRYLALFVGSNELNSERNANALPSAVQADIVVIVKNGRIRFALIPHLHACCEGIADRTVEVLTVYQQVVVRCHTITNPVSVDIMWIVILYQLGIVLLCICITGIMKYRSHLVVCLRCSISLSTCIYQQIPRQIMSLEICYTIVIE